MGQHARLAASKTSMWDPCSGCLTMQDLLPSEDKNVTNDFARLGTCAHALLERVLGEGKTPEDYRGRIITIVAEGTDKEGVSILKPTAKAPKSPTQFWCEVDDDMVDAVDVAVSYVRRRLQELFGHSDTAEAVRRKQLRLERRLTILPEREDSFGTGDITLDAWPEMLENVDYKHGAGVSVEVQGNKQLRSYSIGAAQEDGWDHEVYRYTVCQPRKAHPDGPVRSETATREELQAWKARLLTRAARVDEADAIARDLGSGGEAFLIPDALMAAGLLTAGDHCKWCDAKYNKGLDKACPALRKLAEDTAAADFDEEPTERGDPPREPEELGSILRWAPAITAFLDAVRVAAWQMARSGTKVPYHKVVQGKSPGRALLEMVPARDSVTGEMVLGEDGEPLAVPLTPELMRSALSRYGVPDEKLARAMTDPVPAKLKTGPQLEQLVPKKHKPAFSAEFMYRREGQLTLVHEDDPRDEVTVNPALDFDDETPEVPEDGLD